jgi:hypothetical protein
MLKENKIQTGFSLTKDLPRYEEDPPVPFSEEDLKKVFKAMNAEESLRYKFFLGTACRDRGAVYDLAGY